MNGKAGVLIDIVLPRRSARAERIVTLGPPGTSSEAAARYLDRRLTAEHGCHSTTALYDAYEDAAAALCAGDGSMLLVANAYAGINEFYMDTRLSLAGAFVFDTPRYGLATLAGTKVEGQVRVASHPAPIPLIEQLIHPGLRVTEVVRVNSTSAAAAAVAKRSVDLALTTEPAAKEHGLSFVTATRNIRMLWSVFTPSTRSRRERLDDSLAHVLEDY